METNRVSHICLIDENQNIYFDDNKKLDWLSFIWWKLKENEDFLDWAFRELNEETRSFFNIINKTVLELIEDNSEIIDWILWEWKLYWLKISSNQWDLLLKNANNIKKVSLKNLEKTLFSKKINKNNLINRVKKTIETLINKK
jgi:hypothetical protein